MRVSSAGQAARDTPADQRADLDRLRKSRPGVLVERIEQQVSGAAAGADRPDLSRLAELAAAAAFDEVRVRHLDRLTRHDDPLERAAVLSLVRRAGALIVDAGGSVLDPATMGGELMWVFSTLASAEERRKILVRTQAAKRRLAAEGRLVNGVAPWGRRWSRADGWSLDEPRARDYRRLFELALEGRSLSEIASALEAEGIESPRQRPWTFSMVHRLIRSPRASGRWHSHGAEARIPAVVDEQTQRAAMARLKTHDHAGGRHARYPALLRKLLVCGVCGAPCRTNKNRPSSALYYHCSARDPACYREHNAEAVDDAVRARLTDWARRPAPQEAARRTGPEVVDDAQRDAAAAAKALKRLDAEEERLGRLGVRGGLSERTATKLMRELAQRRETAQQDAADAQARIEAAARRTELSASVESRVAELRQRIDRFGYQDWRDLCEALFQRAAGHSVAIWPDGRIRLNGALPFESPGRGKASRSSWKTTGIPVRLDAQKALRSVR